MAKLLTRCPICSGSMYITEIACDNCDTSIESKFEMCRFCTLSPEHLAFIEVFLRCEGNLSRVEKELGLSYPTVRNRLTNALNAMNLGESTSTNVETNEEAESVTTDYTPEEKAMKRSEILNQLARGEVSAEDAARILRELS